CSRRRRGFRQDLSGTNDLGRGDGESCRYRGKCALGATDSRVDSPTQGAEAAAPGRVRQSCFGIRFKLLPCLVLARSGGLEKFAFAPLIGAKRTSINVDL